MITLKTLNGSRIQRYKNSVGKQVGSRIYVHKNYATEIVPNDVYILGQQLLPKDFQFNCIMYDIKTPGLVRFDSAIDFDVSREPTPGDMIVVDTQKKTLIRRKSKQIWHHKWLWVKDDYEGFDVLNSWMWSERWLSRVKGIASGSRSKWHDQLICAGIDWKSGELADD